jgi:hypothetical protein
MLQIHTELPSDVEHYDLCLVFPVDYSSSEDGALFETGDMVIEKLVRAIGLKYLYFLRQDNFLKAMAYASAQPRAICTCLCEEE